MDWNLRSCGRRGHITYVPDEEEMRAALHAHTALGEAWRCLRCGDFVLGKPQASGPAQNAPSVLRGRGLRDAVILRLLAVERLVRGLIVLLAAYAVFRFRDHRGNVTKALNADLPLIKPLADKFHWDIANSSVVHTIRQVIEVDKGTLTWVAVGLFSYGMLQLIEATGLWLLKRWGEYFAVVATSLFIPIEVYELTEKITWVRIGALLINVGAVVYLLLTKRLFGLRGGSEAHEAARHEANLMEVQTASASASMGKRSSAGSDAAARNGAAAGASRTDSGAPAAHGEVDPPTAPDDGATSAPSASEPAASTSEPAPSTSEPATTAT